MKIPKKIKRNNKNKGSISELRQDLVTGEWIVIAQVRAKRPSDYQRSERSVLDASLDKCPFENPQASGNADPILLYKKADDSDWSLQVIPNKYPAVDHSGKCGIVNKHGPYSIQDGKGFHEVIVPRDHDKHFAVYSSEEAREIIQAYQERYKSLKEEECVKYISIFHNHGKEAGASLHHPHSQLVAIPVMPSDVYRSLQGSSRYYDENQECAHCTIIKWEQEQEERIIFENDKFIAYCPFASRTAFEIQIFPKEHQSNFEELSEDAFTELGDALRTSLNKLHDVLDDPAYNFFIHTAPVGKKKKYPNYHWHVEIMPKTAIWAGFELGTGIEISAIEPKEAAKYLREG
ncbi:MAG: DUF4931 domain-containing protein [Candidatus Spechtbacterales bacterium]|nr:DUF4931 domain-containing protein [Candidatus Spechtbacterales bacterium]